MVASVETSEIADDVFVNAVEDEGGSLSGGEAKMLALGRGLMSAADFMAIDEPSLGLAPNLVRTMLDTIERIKKSGITIMLIEQNTSQLEKFIDRVYVLEEGKIAGESSIEALRRQAARV